MQIHASQEPTYKQILVETEPNRFLVTLDDRRNDEKRYWGFHGGTIYPHITGYYSFAIAKLRGIEPDWPNPLNSNLPA